MVLENILPITGEYLVNVFRDPEFIAQVKMVNDFKDFETAFKVEQALYDAEYRISDITIGDGDEMSNTIELDGAEDLCKSVNFELSHGSSYPLIDLHTHPPGYLAPSTFEEGGGDLSSLNLDREIQIRTDYLDASPIMVILGQTNSQNIDMLLVQESTKNMLTPWDLEERIGDSLDDIVSNREILRILRETEAYRAEIITLNSSNDRYIKGSIKKIKNFSLTPRIVDTKAFAERKELYSGL